MTLTKARPLTGLLSAALLTATLTGATAAQDEEFEITPEGADWTLLAYTVDDTITPIPFGVEVTMYLEDGEVSALAAPCFVVFMASASALFMVIDEQVSGPGARDPMNEVPVEDGATA